MEEQSETPVRIVGYVDIDDTKVVFPSIKPTYEEYVELVNKVSNSHISYMCSSLSTAAGKVNQVFGVRKWYVSLGSRCYYFIFYER